MKTVLCSLLTFVVFFSLNAQYTESDFREYKKLNDQETRLSAYKDTDDMLRLKLQQLDVINKSRKRYRAKPVKLDILASRVANKQSQEAAEGEFRGHWNLRGEKPYHRYAFAGGRDHVTENAAATWMTGGSFDMRPETYSKLMVDLHGQFMAEKKPHDGHKQTVIQKDHNYVGIGCFMTKSQFRYYEEFVDRYADIADVPLRFSPGQEFSIDIKPYDNKYLYYAVAYYEKAPKPISQKEANRKSSYPDYTNDAAVTFAPWDLSKYRDTSGTYSVPWSFSKKGTYYIQMLVDAKDPSNVNSFNTEGKIVATGVVVRVE